MRSTITGPAHWVCLGDSTQLRPVVDRFKLVTCSPPFFNPDKCRQRMRALHSDLHTYIRRFRGVMEASTAALSEDGVVCLIKTDAWIHGSVLQLGQFLLDEMQQLRFQLVQELIWVRRSYYSPYGPSYSHVFVLARHHQRVSRTRHDVLRYADQPASSRVPPELFTFLIDEFTSEGDCILNPYLGSGSFVVAAAASARKSLGIEIDAVTYRSAKERLRETFKPNEVGFLSLREVLKRGHLWEPS